MELSNKKVLNLEKLVDIQAAMAGASRSCQEITRLALRFPAVLEQYGEDELDGIADLARVLNGKLNMLESQLSADAVAGRKYYV